MHTVTNLIELDLAFYDSDEAAQAEQAAADTGQVVYTRGASGRSNWLSQGFHIADRLGYVLLPPGLPDYLDMPDDAPEPGDEPEVASHEFPDWERISPVWSVSDDYARDVLGFSFDGTQIRKLASLLVAVYRGAGDRLREPKALPADAAQVELAGLTPRQFALIRLMHALQDFSELLPPIDESLVASLRAKFGGIPDEKMLADEERARALLASFGGADRNVNERERYVFSTARMLAGLRCEGAYGLFKLCDGDAKRIFEELIKFPGLKSKKAFMVLRDFYEAGIWKYERNLEFLNVIPDNRIMRLALRTGILKPAMGKLLNSLLDQFDFQYVLTVAATGEAFRRVWAATADLNGGKPIVAYPGRLDEFLFRLADPRSGCCKPYAKVCATGKTPHRFRAWLAEEFNFAPQGICPFEDVCPESTRTMQAPFAIQNRTWMNIFTGPGGGGGLRGV